MDGREIKKIELEPEPKEPWKVKWASLVAATQRHKCINQLFQICKRKKLEVVINTVEDGRVVVSIGGSIGIARGPMRAFRRAAIAWDEDNRPRKVKGK